MVTRLTTVIISKCMEISNHYAVPGTNIVLQVNCISKTNKVIEKEIRFVAREARDVRRGYWIKAAKVQTSGYKIDKNQGCNNMINIVNTAVCFIYRKVVTRVNPKSSHHKVE